MNNEFKVHILTPEGLDIMKEVADLFDGLLNGLTRLSPVNSREFSIVKTKLEEACFFAKKNIASCHVREE